MTTPSTPPSSLSSSRSSINTPSYRPEDDGYLILIEPGDVDRVLSNLDMPWRLSEVPFEAVTVVDGCFHVVYISGNQSGILNSLKFTVWPQILAEYFPELDE